MHINKYFLVGFASVIFQIGNIDAESIFATQDASIKEDDSVNGNWSMNEVYGGSSAIVALVEFDLSGFSTDNNVQTATFSPYVRTLKDDQPSTFSIYSTTPKEWSQSSVQWSTRPLKDQFLDIVTITTDGLYVDFDVTNAIQAAIDNGQSKVTLWIEDSEKDYEGFEFDSVNKNSSYPNEPQLVIVSGVAEPDKTAPTFSSAATSTDGTKVILTYNESLSSTTAAKSDFTLVIDGSTATISSVATSGSTVELTLSSAVVYGQTITVAYTDPTSGNDSNAIQDGAGNDAGYLITTTVSNQVAEAGQGNLQIIGSTVNDKDWNENVGGGHLRADLSQLNDRDTSKAINYQWYVNDVAIGGATSRDFKFEEHGITKGEIHLVARYTTLNGQQQSSTSPSLNQLDWRIFSGGEDPSITGDYPYTGIMESNLIGDNPTPFMATYSFASSSRTHGGNGWYEDGYRASETHSITSVKASDQGLQKQEGTNILKIAATSDSKRVEWGNRNFNTRVQENQNVYVSQKIYLPSSEWDDVTQYSTIIYQHKQYPGSDPNFEIRLSNLGDYKLYVRSPYSHYGLTGQKVTDYPIATLNPDTWHDFKIHLTPSKSNNVGQMTIYLDGEVIFSEQGTNLNDIDSTNDSFLKLGMYTQILDDRHYFVDSVEMTTFLPSTVSDWVSGVAEPDKTAPTFSSAATSTDGTKVILTYNESLSSTTAAKSDFTLVIDGSAATISSVATSGSTVELTLSSAVVYGQTITVAYTDPTSGNDDTSAIQDIAGNDASSLGVTSVTNERTAPNPDPTPVSSFASELRILGIAEDYSGVRGVLLADIYGVADLDQAKTYSYQWLANGNAIAGATTKTLDVGDFKSSIENKEISVQLTYANTSGQQKTITSTLMPYEGFRIVANAEDGRNEWSGLTASEEVDNSVNPYPFVESYSNNGTSSTDGTSAGSAHNITAVKASDVGITAREGDNVIRIYADGGKSNRSELAHLNNETAFKEGEEYYFSGSFYSSKDEWDPVTDGGSTVITQLKQYGGGDPNFELRLSNNGDYKMFWRAVPHELDAYQDMGSAIPDAWNDLKIYTKHSQGSDGVFQVWLNNEKVINYSGATMYRSAEGYLKFGMYTEIHDERIIYWDAIDIADHLEKDFSTWLSSGDNLPSLTVNGISDNQQFANSDELSISGSAIDPAGNQLGTSGGIQSVDLFLGDTKIQSTTESDFSFSNLNLSNGEHKLRLVATDTDGNTAEKNYTIWIGNKPAEISIEASDFFLGSFNTDSDVALTTTAADSDGSIVTVEFLANGQLIGTASKGNGNQYSLNWRPSQAGAYSIQARATDNQGAVTLSDSKAALVGASITGSTLTATQDVTITQNSSSTGNYSNTEIYGSTSAPKIALVEFDLSDIISAKYIQSAVFKPYVTKLQNSPGTFSIYAAGTVDWSQTSADWYDKPSKGKLLDTITISSTNQYVSFDVTEALQDAIDAGQAKITLWIEDSEQEQQRFDFASENNSSINKPAQLIISSSTEALPIPVAGSFKLDGDSGDYNGDTGGETEPVLNPAAAGLYPIDVTGSAGAEIKVPFLVNNFQGISGIQTTITWDESVIQLVMDGDNPKISDSPEIMTGFPFILPNYFSVYSNNALTMVWDESIDPENGRSLDDESVLFALHFTLIGNAGDTGLIRLSDDPTPFKLAPGSGEDIDETTQWAEITLINEFTVSGNVTMVGDASSLPVSGVMVTLNQDGSDNDTLTDVSGDYSFTLTSGSGIKLSANLAHGEGKASRGVDVADIVEMRKHILARVRFENARKMTAADTNRDASVDVADIVAMRKVILARTDYFSEDGDGNKEAFWRFVDVDFVGLSADAAFDQVESFEKIAIGNLSSDFSELDFAAIKLGDVNGDWTDPSATTLSGRNAMESARLMRLSAPQATSDGSVSIDLHADGMQGLLGMQFGLNWDGQVLRLEGIETHQLPGFSQQAHSHLQEGNAQVAWDNAMLNDLNLVASEPVMTLHFTLQPGANRGTSIELTQLVLVGSNGSERAALGVASYYHPEGGTMLSSQGLIRSMHRSEGNLSLEFATQEGTSYVVESTEALATGQWKAITTVEGSGRHEVIEMPTTEQAQSYLRVREISGIVK